LFYSKGERKGGEPTFSSEKRPRREKKEIREGLEEEKRRVMLEKKKNRFGLGKK